MKYDIVEMNSIKVMGKELITTNAENKFGEVWADFFKTYTGGQPIAVYTDYESDANGKFTFIVGVKTDTTDNARAFSGGKYLKFSLPDRDKVFECWQFIWSHDLNRAYIADFEIYNADGSVDIYVGVKSEQGGAAKSRCGINCDECAYKEQVNCKGCLEISKPFWGEVCPIKSCCEGKSIAHCGRCADGFPCEVLNQFSYDKEQGDNGKRIEQCKEWCKNGV